ncbi:redoxin domain-containing protein [Candidatus Bathyarchaeota archaeon]|nr:redoxin domain-containing protein [Candidatus Bathyarchaeota archaeon]
MLKIGQVAPDFTLINTEMELKNLSDWSDSNLVIAFYPGAFTGTCKKEMCTLRDDLAKLEGLNTQIIGISVNDPFSQKAFRDENMINFPLLCDYNREVIRGFDVMHQNFAGLKDYTAAKRSIFIIDTNKIIQYIWITNDPSKEPNYYEINKKIESLLTQNG